jgi:predicted kinase
VPILASSAWSSGRKQIPHARKLTELLKVNKKIVGNRKTDAPLTLHEIVDADRNVVPVEHGLYTNAASEATYAQLLARQVVAAGCPVIIDAAFLKRRQRIEFRLLAAALGVPFFPFDLQAPVDTLWHGVTARQHLQHHASDAYLKVLKHQIATAEPLAGEETAGVIVIDGEALFDPANVALSCATVLQKLGIAKPTV